MDASRDMVDNRSCHALTYQRKCHDKIDKRLVSRLFTEFLRNPVACDTAKNHARDTIL